MPPSPIARRAVTIQPKDPEAQVALGNALFKKGKPTNRSFITGKRWRYGLITFAAHYNLSSVLLKKGEIDKAILHCRAAYRHGRRRRRAHYPGRCLSSKG